MKFRSSILFTLVMMVAVACSPRGSNRTGIYVAPENPTPLLKKYRKKLSPKGRVLAIGTEPLLRRNGLLALAQSPSLVDKMEKSWNDLPRMAAVIRESRGWRVTQVTPDSLFDQAGFRVGDLITTDFLKATSKKVTHQQIQLVLRMQQILNRIARD